VQLATGQVDADKSGPDDHLHIVGVAPAVVTVVHPDDGELVRLGLDNRELCGAVDGDVPEVVATIEQGGHRGVMDYSHRLAWFLGLDIPGDGETLT